MVRRPARVVIGIGSFPEQHVAESKCGAFALCDRSRRQHVGMLHSKPPGKRPEGRRRKPRRDDDALRGDYALRSADTDATSRCLDAPDSRLLEDARSVVRRLRSRPTHALSDPAAHSPSSEWHLGPAMPVSLNNEAGETHSARSASMPRFEKLSCDDNVDVVIVGGGITGPDRCLPPVSQGESGGCAERARCAMVDTGHTTAHLTMVTDTRLSELDDRSAATTRRLRGTQVSPPLLRLTTSCAATHRLRLRVGARGTSTHRATDRSETTSRRLRGGGGDRDGAGIRRRVRRRRTADGRTRSALCRSGALSSPQVSRGTGAKPFGKRAPNLRAQRRAENLTTARCA